VYVPLAQAFVLGFSSFSLGGRLVVVIVVTEVVVEVVVVVVLVVVVVVVVVAVVISKCRVVAYCSG
jgi:hypothetical protein